MNDHQHDETYRVGGLKSHNNFYLHLYQDWYQDW